MKSVPLLGRAGNLCLLLAFESEGATRRLDARQVMVEWWKGRKLRVAQPGGEDYEE
jgi:hypothetical protein